jgi:hypothetical protein
VTKPEYPEKTTNLSQVTDKLHHIMLYTSPWSRFEFIASVVIGTDCIGSCKCNYHTITSTTDPLIVATGVEQSEEVLPLVSNKPRKWYIIELTHIMCNELWLLSVDLILTKPLKGPSWTWLYGSCIYNYLCNRCLSPRSTPVATLPLFVRHQWQHFLALFDTSFNPSSVCSTPVATLPRFVRHQWQHFLALFDTSGNTSGV